MTRALYCFLVLLALKSAAFATDSTLHVSIYAQGMAKADISANVPRPDPQVAQIMLFLLPFQLDPQFEVTKADNIAVSLTINRENYSLLTVVVAPGVSHLAFTIEKAFVIAPDREKNRVLFSFDLSYANFKLYGSLLNSQNTISKYDLEIELPRAYDPDVLSFNPTWIPKGNSGSAANTYWLSNSSAQSLLASNLPNKSIYFSFPNPFESQSNLAALVMGLVPGLIAMATGSAYVAQRRLSRLALSLILALTTFGLAAVLFFYLTLPNPISFLVTSVGAALPWIPAPFVCLYYLIRASYDGKITGRVFLGGQGARYATVRVLEKGAAGTNDREIATSQIDNNDGEYQFLIWCRRTRYIYVIAKKGSSEKQTAEYEIARKTPIHIPTIEL